LIALLATSLGKSAQIVAFLDNMYVLSTKSGVLYDIYAFFDCETTSLRLIRLKCAKYTLEYMKTVGIKLLGTFVGPASGRRAFLAQKVAKSIAKLASLSSSPLPYQHQLLLLRQCNQQDLCHLQQTLKTCDIEDASETAFGRGVCSTRVCSRCGRGRFRAGTVSG